MGDNKRWSAADAAAVGWAALHIYTGVSGFGYGLYQTYTTRFWILLAVWILGLLALDGWLAGGRPGLLRFAKWYWGLSAGMYGALILLAWLDASISDMLTVFLGLCALLTPMFQLMAVSWALLQNLGTRIPDHVELYAQLAFCLIHFLYFTWLHRRARERGALSDGPVDPGAGTVE